MTTTIEISRESRAEPPLTVRRGWNRALLGVHVAVFAIHCWLLHANLREPGCFPPRAFVPANQLLMLSILVWFSFGVRGIRIGPRLVCVPLVFLGAALWAGGTCFATAFVFRRIAGA